MKTITKANQRPLFFKNLFIKKQKKTIQEILKENNYIFIKYSQKKKKKNKKTKSSLFQCN